MPFMDELVPPLAMPVLPLLVNTGKYWSLLSE